MQMLTQTQHANVNTNTTYKCGWILILTIVIMYMAGKKLYFSEKSVVMGVVSIQRYVIKSSTFK